MFILICNGYDEILEQPPFRMDRWIRKNYQRTGVGSFRNRRSERRERLEHRRKIPRNIPRKRKNQNS